MTREEAITYLNVIWNRYKAEYEIERETLDAYHMAIEALSEGNIARDIATIIENEQDMRVILNLVRCKDCRHWYKKMDKCNRCPSISGNWGENDFCSYGERREP